jgi:hypothetical protein
MIAAHCRIATDFAMVIRRTLCGPGDLVYPTVQTRRHGLELGLKGLPLVRSLRIYLGL